MPVPGPIKSAVDNADDAIDKADPILEALLGGLSSLPVVGPWAKLGLTVWQDVKGAVDGIRAAVDASS